MDMYVDGIISRDELNSKAKTLTSDINNLENELKSAEYNLTAGEHLEEIIDSTFREIKDIVAVEKMTNEQLKKVIDKMIVFPDGTVDIYLKMLSEYGISPNVLFRNDRT